MEYFDIGDVFEICSVLAILHGLYGIGIREKRGTLSAWLLMNLCGIYVMWILRKYQMGGGGVLLLYMVFAVYCLVWLDKSVFRMIVNLLAALSLGALFQSLYSLFVWFIFHANNDLTQMVKKALQLLYSLCVFPALKPWRLWQGRTRRQKVCRGIFLAVLALEGCFFVLQKLLMGVSQELVMLLSLVFLALVPLLGQWEKLNREKDSLERELNKRREEERQYEEFVTEVRLRQHELNNHITAILSMHHIYSDYESLVKAQEEYFAPLRAENRFLGLLSLGNSAVVGFLIKKLQEAEGRGVKVELAQKAGKLETITPSFCLIEMLGILLDNAVEAVLEVDEAEAREAGEEPGVTGKGPGVTGEEPGVTGKDLGVTGKEPSALSLGITIRKAGQSYSFVVENPFRQVSYGEIVGWFQKGKSTKGTDRGLGLYHLKLLCKKYGCEIGCRCVEGREKAGEYKIQFTLTAP